MLPVEKNSDEALILAVLQDFYISLFPKKSIFELPDNYRNRFLYIEEYRAWKSSRVAIVYVISAFFVLAVLVSLYTCFKLEVSIGTYLIFF